MNEVEKYHLHPQEPNKLPFDFFEMENYLPEHQKFTQKPHTHSFYQILWFLEGEGTHFIDFQSYEVVPNRIFFIHKGQIHAFDNAHYQGYILHFNESFIADDQNYIPRCIKNNIFDSFSNQPFLDISREKITDLQQIISQIKSEISQEETFAHSLYLKNLLTLFLIEYQRIKLKNHQNQLSVNHPKHLLFVHFREQIEKDFKTHHNIAQYADHLNISTKTLTNCTKEITGQTPLEMVSERISLEAKRLLMHSDKNINEIAFELGFEESSYFVKFFKRLNQMRPSEFRKKIQN